ncbi:MAG TPA: hypothetical protein VF881_12205 [Polyangiaceae bacterium]
MEKNPRAPEDSFVEERLDVSHLRREARTGLELAIVALAPWDLVERLAMAAGLLEAMGELPSDAPPVRTLVPKVLVRARGAIEEWQEWHRKNLEQKLPRG